MSSALRDVGAKHHAHSGVCSEAPWGLSAIWIPTVVFSEVPGKKEIQIGGVIQWDWTILDCVMI